MAIRFADKPSDDASRRPITASPPKEGVQAEGEARFATPIEAARPVHPDTAGQLPFTDLPPAEKAERRKRSPKPAAPK